MNGERQHKLSGYVCLVRWKKHYRLQSLIVSESETDEPFDMELVHVIATDNASYVRDGLNKRFFLKLTSNGWLHLSREDVEYIRSVPGSLPRDVVHTMRPVMRAQEIRDLKQCLDQYPQSHSKKVDIGSEYADVAEAR